MKPEPPENPSIRFRVVGYRVVQQGEYFWADGDEEPSVCQLLRGMDLSYHNSGKRWVLEVEDAE